MLITPINKQKELSGIEATYYGVTFTIARANNTNFKHLFRTLIAPYKYQMENNQSVPDDISEDIMLQCYSKTILLNWRNLVNPATGEEVPYSVGEAYASLKEDEDLYDFIKAQANNIDAFLEKSEDETKGK